MALSALRNEIKVRVAAAGSFDICAQTPSNHDKYSSICLISLLLREQAK